MSFNQFRSDKASDSQYRKPGNRSGNTASSYQRTNSGKSSGGGGPAPPGSLQSSRSFKKTNSVQGGPSRVGAPSVSPELNNAPAPTRNAQNGVHQQAPSREMADGPARTAAARITELPSTPSSNPADPKILPLQSASGSSNPKLMQTPPKTEGGPPKGFPLQFGSISPGFVNGMQIPPRTTSAPPNLDEQKRDQVRVEFSRPAPAVPIPSVPKQQWAVKESSVAKQKHPLVAVSHPLPDMKKKTHAPSQAPLSLPQKPSAVHVSGMPMPVKIWIQKADAAGFKKKKKKKKADAAGSTSDAYKGPDSGPGRGSDRSAGGARSDRRENLLVGDDKWNKGPGPYPSRDQRADVGYGNTMGGFRPDSGGNSGVLRYPSGQVPGPDSGPGRGSDRSVGGARSDRRENLPVGDDKWNKGPGPYPSREQIADVGYGNTMGGFRPGSGGNSGVLRYPSGQVPGHHPGGILTGPVQPLNTSQRDNADTDRWQRGTNFQKGLIPSPQTPAQMMHKAEKKYERGKVADEEQAKQRQLKGILNKLTPQNFERLFEQVKAVNIDNAMTLTGVISQIFDKVLMEPTFCEMYVDFCFHLAGELPDFSEGDEKITFIRVLLNKCQEEFERGEREQEEADRVEVGGEGTQCNEEREEERVQARRRMLGNIRLIGELYKKKMLTERIMHECIKKLMGQHQNPDEEDIEALCKLMSTIGEMIDHPKAKEHMDAYFDVMGALSNNMRYSSRVRFMLKDSIDLRRNKWQQRRKVEGPKKIEEVHRDAAHERQAQSRRLTRGPSMNASSRRGTLADFGPRGSSVLASPSSQTGGLRNFRSQGQRFGGTQDVRVEDWQSLYESRNMSVSLPQRAAGNDTLTLGPQGGHHPGCILSGPLQPLNTSQRESKERVVYLQSKVSKQTSIDMKEETKDGIMGTNNSSITIEVEQLERESKKSLTPSVGIEFSKTVEVDLVPSAVFTGNHGTTSDESDLSNTVLELKDTASLSVAGSNDRAPLEMSRPKSATAKGKRQKKELLQKADAAGSTSDLYTAYKGPENKELTLSTESSEGGSGCIDLKKLPADTKECIKAGKSEAQVKSEPKNWEDAEDIRGEGGEPAMAKASASASSFAYLFARGGEVAMGVLSNKVDRDLIKPGDHIYSWRSAYLYSHHGIYAGDGKVIHFTRGAGQEIGTGTALDKFIFSSSPSHNPINPCPNCGDQSRLDGVICSCLDCFLAGGDLYLFKYDVKVAYFLAKARGGTCTLAESDPPGAALHRASFLLENGFGVYHISKNNCEDFAIYCKTGLVSENIFSVPRSGQAASFMAFATTVMSSPLRFLITNLGGLAVVANFGGLAVGAGLYCVSRLASDMGVRRDVVRVPVETLVKYFGTRRR